jgi:serine/threonine-protein kinase
VYEERFPVTSERANEVNADRDPVGFVGTDTPRFADETAALLRRRLMAAALILSSVLVVAFVGNLLLGNIPLIGLRVTVLLVFVSSFLFLRSRATLSLRQLRFFELAIFGTLTIQLMLMMYARIWAFVVVPDATSAIAIRHLYLSAYCIVILTYGIFMPNTWKRSVLVLAPLAGLPYFVLALLCWHVPETTEALASSSAVAPVPLPFVAAMVAVFGAHIINSVRRDEFRARQLGQYHLKRQLGVGGMGVVYEAEHRMLKRPCAVKLIRPENEMDERAIARFEREVRSTAKLSHWNTVEVFDYGHTEDGTFYYVMELLPGLSLDEMVKRHGPMPAGRTVHFLRQICRALREAHAVGLIHRDIKPANVFAACRGGIHVIAPEQAKDYENTDARGDIYALGAVGYFLLTGQPPFIGKNAFEVLVAHHTRPVVPPSQIESTVPADVEQVVLRCLEKAPDQRYQNAESLEDALSTCQCAAAWTDEKAATWWSLHEPEQDVAEPS